MIERVAYITVHTSPLAQPGTGDAGGMNVYIDELATTMAGRGVEVDVFTRRTSPDQPDLVDAAGGYRVVHITAGPDDGLPVAKLPDIVEDFAGGVMGWIDRHGGAYDVLHSHYWLSGWAGVLLKERFGIPLANSFHTLGRVKDATRSDGEVPESLVRLATEHEVIARSDCVISSTPAEFDDLIVHYGASPERLCVSPPGVDHRVFAPGPRAAAREALGIEWGPILLAAGRIQPLKRFDVAVEALAVLLHGHPTARLVIIGGPSGPQGEAEIAHLRSLARNRGIAGSLVMLPPQPHWRLADYYRAADVVLVPSRTESFGLVAAEAQACGVPVVAAGVGGLRYAVADGESGFLVDGWDPTAYARRAVEILDDPAMAARLSKGALAHSEQFSWEATADRLLELYAGISGK